MTDHTAFLIVELWKRGFGVDVLTNHFKTTTYQIFLVTRNTIREFPQARPNRRLSKQTVEIIKNLRARGLRHGDIADAVGYHYNTIGDVLKGNRPYDKFSMMSIEEHISDIEAGIPKPLAYVPLPPETEVILEDVWRAQAVALIDAVQTALGGLKELLEKIASSKA